MLDNVNDIPIRVRWSLVTRYVELHKIKYHLQAKAGLVESMELQLVQAAEDNYLDDVKLTTVYPNIWLIPTLKWSLGFETMVSHWSDLQKSGVHQ